jgi:hypothetical protein
MGKDIRMTTHDDAEQLDDNLDAEIEALADNPDALRKLLRGKVATEAIKALVHVCRSQKAPAAAKATAGSSLLRAGSYFERVDIAEDAEPLTIEKLEMFESRLKAVADAMPPEPAPKPSGNSPKWGKPSGGLFD